MADPNDITTVFYEPMAKTGKSPGSLVPGMVLNGKYELLEQIGRGGMGVVWKAQAKVADRLVALKFVPKELKRFDAEMERVRTSFKKIHALNHQWICPIYGLEDGGEFGYYLVMKYLEGETLDSFVLRKDPKRQGLPIDIVVAIIARAAVALDYAHLNKVIHRDIKPGNIFLIKVAGKLHVQLIDFGLVDEIRTSLSRVSQMQFDISGTRPYMAPEQWLGKLQSATTDQYALAVVAYELLAGNLPFLSGDFQILGNAVLNVAPEPIPTISDAANDVLLRALAKDPADRFGSCQEFVSTLNSVWTSVAEEAQASVSERKMPTFRFRMPHWRLGLDTPLWSLEAPLWAQCLTVFLVVFCLGAVILVGLAWNRTASPLPHQQNGERTVEALPQPITTGGQAAGEHIALRTNGIGSLFRWCPPGTFMMGSPASEKERNDHTETLHQVPGERPWYPLFPSSC